MTTFTDQQLKLLRDEKRLSDLIAAKSSTSMLLMAKPNVVALGVGLRTRKGAVHDELTIKVYVSRKLPKELLSEQDLIPSTVSFQNRNIRIDVEEAGVPEAHLFTIRSRPLVGGSSIGLGTRGVQALSVVVSPWMTARLTY